MRKIEMEREVKLRELELREKELAHGNVQPHSTPNLKSKLPKFHEGQDLSITSRSNQCLRKPTNRTANSLNDSSES
jgi:hypothetical protein